MNEPAKTDDARSDKIPMEIRGVPAGCQEIPGFIIDVFDGSLWITQDGKVTDKWVERGIWPTAEAASEMMKKCLM